MNSRQSGLVIGPSTGWLYAKEVYSLTQQEFFLKETRANGLEICLAGWENDKRMLSLKAGGTFEVQNFTYFVYRSLHLPDVNGQEPEYQLTMAQEAVVRCGAATALTHPLKVRSDYPMEYYEKMISGGVPLAVEKMDSRKDSGFNLAELDKLIKIVGCRFVLDVQHAFEHDPEMGYAGDLFESLADTLVHLHVSGETGDNIHSLVHKARNAGKIIEFINGILSRKNVPLILEGEYTNSHELRREIEFLTKELGFC